MYSVIVGAEIHAELHQELAYHLRADRDVEAWGAGQTHSLAQQVQKGKDTVEKQQPLTLRETSVLGRQVQALWTFIRTNTHLIME